MRVLIQRCRRGQVSIDGQVVGAIDRGFVLLVGVTHEDGPEDVTYCARKISKLRVFEDEQGRMNASLDSLPDGAILSISQFTLYGDVRKGNRPSFTQSARPEVAEPLYESLNQALRAAGFRVETGRFGADMQVLIENDGPVTILIDSKEK